MLERVVANWPLKLLALAMSFVIWVSITGENRVVQDFSVPLDVRLPNDRVLTNAPPTTVTVRLRGPESLIRRLDPVLMTVRAELDDPALGEHEMQLTKSNLGRVPRGADVEFIEPNRITLVVDERVRRPLPVEPTFLGHPPEGYAFYGATVAPEKLTVEGPRSETDGLDVIRTSPIRLDRRSAPFTVSVTAVPDGLHLTVLDPSSVRVRVEVDAAPVKRHIDGIPVVVEGQRWVTRVEPATISVEVEGPPRLVDRVLPSQVRATTDVAGIEPSDRDRSVDIRVQLIDIPVEEIQRLSVSAASPRTVRARVSDRRFVP